MKKKILIFLLLNISCFLYGQQLTRFAVVDMPRVYTAFFRESAAVRQWEERSRSVQNEIDRRQREITELMARKAEADLRGDYTEVNRLDTQIYRMETALRDYYQTQTTILEDQRRRLMQSGSFLDQIHEEIRIIAEREGYSMVLDLNENKGIVWYSNSVDITDRLIQSLLSRPGRY